MREARNGSWVGALHASLPHGHELSEEAWRTRHRALLVLVATGIVVLPLPGLATDTSAGESLLAAAVVAAFCALALLLPKRRRLLSLVVSLGLLTATALAIDLAADQVEARYPFFVMLVVIALYEDWVPFAVAVVVVFLDHGPLGALTVLAESVVLIVVWRASQRERASLARAAREQRAILDALDEGVMLLGRDGQPQAANDGFMRIMSASGIRRDGITRQAPPWTGAAGRRDGHGRRGAARDVCRAHRRGDQGPAVLLACRPHRRSQAGRRDPVVDGVLADLRAALEEAEAQVEVGELPVVTGDRVQVRQLFQNLLANAVKFRRGPGVRVWVEAERSGDNWCFAVADDGIGIPPEHRERVFEMFQRLHQREAYEGTGIGLAICRKIVEHHGGSIWVGDRDGGGTVFRFTLPAGVAASGDGGSRRAAAGAV